MGAEGSARRNVPSAWLVCNQRVSLDQPPRPGLAGFRLSNRPRCRFLLRAVKRIGTGSLGLWARGRRRTRHRTGCLPWRPCRIHRPKQQFRREAARNSALTSRFFTRAHATTHARRWRLASSIEHRASRARNALICRCDELWSIVSRSRCVARAPAHR